MHFRCEKLLVVRTREVNRPVGAEDVKSMGVQNLAGGSTTPAPSTRTLNYSYSYKLMDLLSCEFLI